MQDLTVSELEKAKTIVDEAKRHACERFEPFSRLHDRLCSTVLEIEWGLAGGIQLVPPGDQHTNGAILFDPHYILGLAKEHRHPEWVVCARLERLVLQQLGEWETDSVEQQRLAAHDERRRAKSRASKAILVEPTS
jgi:hypothetical protein